MILNVSGRCDVVAFFTPWFMNRLKEGYIDVRNPFYPSQISRILLEEVEAIIFCTKNPFPIIPYLKEIEKPMVFQITLTPYKKDIEPNVINKTKIIQGIQEISKIIGKENVYIRYDPILLNDIYTISYHILAFEKLCTLLEGYTNHIITSFIDNYKNVAKNQNVLRLKELDQQDYFRIGTNFSAIAKKHGMTVQTCSEENNLIEYGFIKKDCVDRNLAFRLTGRTKFKKWTARREKQCNCVEMVDIGVYNCCSHFCKYCYANFDEKKVLQNMKEHDPTSSLLVGHLKKSDKIKIRE